MTILRGHGVAPASASSCLERNRFLSITGFQAVTSSTKSASHWISTCRRLPVPALRIRLIPMSTSRQALIPPVLCSQRMATPPASLPAPPLPDAPRQDLLYRRAVASFCRAVWCCCSCACLTWCSCSTPSCDARDTMLPTLSAEKGNIKTHAADEDEDDSIGVVDVPLAPSPAPAPHRRSSVFERSVHDYEAAMEEGTQRLVPSSLTTSSSRAEPSSKEALIATPSAVRRRRAALRSLFMTPQRQEHQVSRVSFAPPDRPPRPLRGSGADGRRKASTPPSARLLDALEAKSSEDWSKKPGAFFKVSVIPTEWVGPARDGRRSGSSKSRDNPRRPLQAPLRIGEGQG